MKKAILILFVIVALGIGGYFYLNEVDTEPRDPTSFADGERVKLRGYVSEYFEGDEVFILTDRPYKYQVLFDKEINLEMNDYIEVNGVWDMIDETLESRNIKVLSSEEKHDYLKSRYKMIEFEINEYPSSVNSGCETLKFKIDLKNKSDETLEHYNLYDEDFGYQVFIFIDDDRVSAHPFLSEYDQVFNDDNSEPMRDLGYFGFPKFSSIDPDVKKEVDFWAGGKMIEFENLETFKIYNAFSNYEPREYDFSIGWFKVKEHNFLEIYRSQPVNINVVESDC